MFPQLFINDSSKILILTFIIFLCIPNIDAQENNKKMNSDKNSWPMWRADAGRSGTITISLPEKLNLQWVREFEPPKDAWRDDATLQFATNYHPIAAEGKLFVPSMLNDCVQALDAETGEVVWTAFAGAPVRFAPIYWQGKIFYASDDGKLYCVEAKTGKPLWVFNGAPREKLIIGNDRLISTWPIRGGPVLKDGRIYFANGLWPFMGIFVYCLQADSGAVVWVNDGTLEDGASRDQRVMHRPYEACPGGYMTIADDKLLLPAGRVWPSCYDLKTGKRILYAYRLPIGALKAPCSDLGVIASNGFWFVGCKFSRTWSSVCDARQGSEIVAHINGFPAVDGNLVYASRSGELCAYDFTGKTFNKFYHPGEFSVEGREPKEPFPAIWTTQNAKAQFDPIKIGNYLYYSSWLSSGKRGGVSQLSAIRIPADGEKPVTVWKTTVEGQNPTVLAADGKLFVTTSSGDVMCFGEKLSEVRRWPLIDPTIVKIKDNPELLIKEIDAQTGYSLVLGIGNGDITQALISKTNQYVVVLENDVNKVDEFRRKMFAAGLYGTRIMALCGDIKSAGLPPYFASLIMADPTVKPKVNIDTSNIKSAYNSLRPYGGRLYLGAEFANNGKYEEVFGKVKLEGSKLIKENSFLMRDELPLPTGTWGNANGGNSEKTLSIPDKLIKAPLGLLWFGGDGSDNIFGRLGSVAHIMCSDRGRIFTFNASHIYALDAYTGRMLWSVPSAGYSRDDKGPGTAFFCPVVDTLGLYVSNSRNILEYQPATGKIMRQFPILPEWALGVTGLCILQPEYLLLYSDKAIVCISRKDGKTIWTRQASEKKSLSKMAVGGNHIYFVEGTEKKVVGIQVVPDELESVNLVDGKVEWRVPLAGFPNSIIYSEKTGLVLASWASGNIDARSLKDGQRVWTGNPVLRGGWWNPTMPVAWNDKLILSSGQIIETATGKAETTPHPLTGLPVSWRLPYKGFGCSMPCVIGNLLFSRGLDAVYYDLKNDGNMARLDGFRLACGWSVIPGSGVLAVLNGQQFGMCKCKNPVAAPMGLVHDPDVELWTISQFESPKNGNILRAGINFGAPGNRRATDGSLWMDYPEVAFPPANSEKMPSDLSKLIPSDPHLSITITPAKIEWFRHHTLRIKGDGIKWVASSGGKGLHTLTITLPTPATNLYTVRLVFAEPDSIKIGERIFDVSLQGKKIIEKLDLVATTGEPLTVLTREFKNIQIGSALTVELTPIKGEPVLCGIEFIAEADSK